MVRTFSRLAVVIGLGIILSICLALPVGATALPLYPPGPPYSRLGPGGTPSNFWSDSGQGNPQFFRSGSTFWWQNPPETPPADHA
jgi:hypothetical protein